MRIIVHGIGAVGGTIAAARAEAGRDVLGIARGGMLEAMKDAPMTLRHPGGDVTVRVPVRGPSGRDRFPAGRPDLPDDENRRTRAIALRALRAAGVREQPIFCLQNGIANEPMALRLFPNVHGVTVMMPGHLYRAGCRGLPRNAENWGCSISDAFRSGHDAADAALARAFQTKAAWRASSMTT